MLIILFFSLRVSLMLFDLDHQCMIFWRSNTMSRMIELHPPSKMDLIKGLSQTLHIVNAVVYII